MRNKMKKAKQQHKNVNYNSQLESVKACFGDPKAKTYEDMVRKEFEK